MMLEFFNFEMVYCRKFKRLVKMPDAIFRIFVHLIGYLTPALARGKRNDEDWLCAIADIVSIK